MESNNSPIEVFAGTAWEAALVKSLLDNAEIRSYIIDAIKGTLATWIVTPGGMDATKIVVATEDYPLAKEVVDEFRKNRKG